MNLWELQLAWRADKRDILSMVAANVAAYVAFAGWVFLWVWPFLGGPVWPAVVTTALGTFAVWGAL